MNTGKQHHHRYWDSAERMKWQNPHEILSGTGLKEGMTFIDLGCGNGYFTLPAAGIVGNSGKIYALDANESAINEIREKADAAGLSNIELTAGRAEEALLCHGCADIVFFGIVLHDFDDPAKVLLNAGEMLKSNGLLVNLDWKKERLEYGPPFDIRFSEDNARSLIEGAGFKVKAISDCGPHHYIITASRA